MINYLLKILSRPSKTTPRRLTQTMEHRDPITLVVDKRSPMPIIESDCDCSFIFAEVRMSELMHIRLLLVGVSHKAAMMLFYYCFSIHCA